MKLRELCDDTAKKWKRQSNTGVVYVYVDVFLDLGPIPAEALTELRREAENIVASQPGFRLIVAEAAGTLIVIPPDAPREFAAGRPE